MAVLVTGAEVAAVGTAAEFIGYAALYNLAAYANRASSTGERYDPAKAFPALLFGGLAGVGVYALGGDIYGTDITILALALVVAADQIHSATRSIIECARDIEYHDDMSKKQAYLAALMYIVPHVIATGDAAREASETFAREIEQTEGPLPEPSAENEYPTLGDVDEQDDPDDGPLAEWDGGEGGGGTDPDDDPPDAVVALGGRGDEGEDEHPNGG